MVSQDNFPLLLLAAKRPNLQLDSDEILGKSDFMSPATHSGAAAIVKDNKLVGIFTERDLLKRVLVKDIDLDDAKFVDIMTDDPVTIAHDATLPEALSLITSCGFRYLPVVNGKKFVGMIDIRDLYHAMNALTTEALERQTKIFNNMMHEPYGTGG